MRRAACGIALLAVLIPATAAIDLDAGLHDCRKMARDSERLHCYDQLTAQATTKVAPVPAPQSAPPPVEAGFGAESIRKSASDDSAPQRIQSRVIGKLEGWKKGDLFRLENGQIWKCIDDRDYVLRLENPAVTIHRSFIGSYFMRFDGINAQPRVRRVE